MNLYIREIELLHSLHSLKPSAIAIGGIIDDDIEGLQPYQVKKLEVSYKTFKAFLEKALRKVIPSDELVFFTRSILSEEQIRAIESLGLKRLEVQSWNISRELLEQVNGVNVEKKCVTGRSENKEVWSEEVIPSYGHLFRKEDEPRLEIGLWLEEENEESFLKRASDDLSKAP